MSCNCNNHYGLGDAATPSAASVLTDPKTLTVLTILALPAVALVFLNSWIDKQESRERAW